MKKFPLHTLFCVILEVLGAIDIVIAIVTKEVSVTAYVLSCLLAMLAFLYVELTIRSNKK